MCVAAIIDSDMPDWAIRAMARVNGDGWGIAYPDEDGIRWIKGLRTNRVIAMLPSIPRPYALHVRYATAGGRFPHLTHPFPLGERALAYDVRGSDPAVLIHNGTWGGWRAMTPAHVASRLANGLISDTAVAAYHAGVDESILDSVSWATAVVRDAGGARADVTLRGDWYDWRGSMFSNLNWLPNKRATSHGVTRIGAKRLDRSEWSLDDRGARGETYKTFDTRAPNRAWYTDQLTMPVSDAPPDRARWDSDGDPDVMVTARPRDQRLGDHDEIERFLRECGVGE